ncbi:MAG: D-alanyl-D-alanine carboxypeptidase [Holophagaceae bacterium]|nr:D-alanyl-D-alanine carboxypeptidase [Holophagaceae bacterium]
MSLQGLLVLLLSLATTGGAEPPPGPFPGVARAYLVKVDGRELWAHRADAPMPPASLTKVMTGLLVLERGRLDGVVTVSRAASRETGHRLGLREGDRLRVRDLLTAALVGSANDAAHALADHVAGSEGRFVRLMNRRARELKLTRTRFANASGHDQAGHQASARDLARLAEAAMAQPEFAARAATVYATLHTVDGRRTFQVENQNQLVGRYPGTVGVKSGYTPGAGRCVIAQAEGQGRRATLVLLHAADRWWDAEKLLDRALGRKAGPR